MLCHGIAPTYGPHSCRDSRALGDLCRTVSLQALPWIPTRRRSTARPASTLRPPASLSPKCASVRKPRLLVRKSIPMCGVHPLVDSSSLVVLSPGFALAIIHSRSSGGEGERGFSNDFNVCIRARVRVGGEDTPRARIWGEGVGGQRQNARISSKGEIWRRRKPLQTRICGEGEGGSEKCTHSLAFEGWRQVWVP